MAVKLRLQRHGKKGKPFFHIVAADARAPRDGKYIERLGSYNPNTNPATILLDNKRAIGWLTNGAQPSDTVRAILSYTGVLFEQHLAKGVAKGALTQDAADSKLETWMADKAGKVQAKKDGLVQSKVDAQSKALKHERSVNENRLKAMTSAAEQASEAAAVEQASAAAAIKAEAVKAVVVENVPTEAPIAVAEVVATIEAEAPVEAPIAEAEVVPTVEAEAPVAETPAPDAPAENTEA